jgi:hypothetical protein
MYVHNPWIKRSNKSAAICNRQFVRAVHNSEKIISTTSSLNIVDYICVNCGLPHSGARRRALAQTICNARGLAAAHSRKLSATLGGSTSTLPGVQKITLKTCDFVDISNATIPIALEGSTTASIVILRQQLDYVIVDYAAPTTPHPIKAKFSSSKNRLLFTFAAPDTRGLHHKKSSCISLTKKNCESPSSWRFLLNP